MVDCSECKWKNVIKGSQNTLSCKKDDNMDCDYRCTPFHGENFVNTYFSENFKEKFFCDGPTNLVSCEERNIKLKNEGWNTNKDICIYDSLDNKCKISDEINLFNMVGNSNLSSLKNSDIYNPEYLLENSENLIEITDSELYLDNSSIISDCSIENFYNENNCELKDINNCNNSEGCYYDLETNYCSNKDLTLPQIDLSKYYADLHSSTQQNNIFSRLYTKYDNIRDINNWPCIDSESEYPFNCKNNSFFEKLYIKSQYKSLDGNYNNIIIPPEQFQIDKENLIELINNRCFDNFGVSSCNEIDSEATLENIEEYAKMIRNNTLSIFNELMPYDLDRLPYLLLIELELYLESQESENLEKIVGNIKDINNLQLYSEKTDLFIEKLRDNDELRFCFNDLLYVSNEEESLNFVLNNKLENWESYHFDYLNDKIDKFIQLSPSSVNSCLTNIDDINQHICNGEITTGTISLISLVLEIIGANIDINNIDKTDPNFISLQNIIIPKIPSVVKKITELSEYYETKNCGTINNKSQLLLEFYKQVLQPDKPIINYHLFSETKLSKFFDDFLNGNIFMKIILLIFIYLIISNLIKIFRKSNIE